MSENIEKTQSKSAIARINLLLTLALFAAIILVAYYGLIFKQGLDKRIQQLQLKNTMMTAANATNLANLDGKVTLIQHNLRQISKSQVELYQLSELVALANQVLIVYGDSNGCLRLLDYAKQQLSTNNNPEFDNLKVALGYDMARLEDANTIDKTILSGEIDSLNDAVVAINFDTNLVNSARSIQVEQSKWRKFFLNIQDTLLNLVVVSKTSGGELLVPKNEDIAKENIRFDLFSAKVALLGQNQKAWEYNLQQANYYVTTYFKEYAGVDKISAKITALAKTSIANDNINIDKTIKAINKLKALQD